MVSFLNRDKHMSRMRSTTAGAHPGSTVLVPTLKHFNPSQNGRPSRGGSADPMPCRVRVTDLIPLGRSPSKDMGDCDFATSSVQLLNVHASISLSGDSRSPALSSPLCTGAPYTPICALSPERDSVCRNWEDRRLPADLELQVLRLLGPLGYDDLGDAERSAYDAIERAIPLSELCAILNGLLQGQASLADFVRDALGATEIVNG